MKMEDTALLAPAATGGTAPEVVQQIGQLTRQLHDTLRQLGVMPKLQVATDGLPDARSRLTYIAEKTAAAADKVLTLVDASKTVQGQLVGRIGALRADVDAGRLGPAELSAALGDLATTGAEVDANLTDIMMAQDFHDLTGQVVQKVVALANDLEDSLVKLLVQVVPSEAREKVDPTALHGPVVDFEGRTDVVQNQGEVDDLLASLGF